MVFSIFDTLYCEEDGFFFEEVEKSDEHQNEQKSLALLENDLLWENDEILSLLSKEKESHLGFLNNNNNSNNPDGVLMVSRKETLEWVFKVVGHYGFTALTGVLAVNYYDRFVSSFMFKKDNPWMSQLVAVTCLSIAAKMEEIRVPLLLNLQVENAKYMFESKTIMRMEILILSTLKWKTFLVTPISFIDHFTRRFKFMTNLHCDFLVRCDHVLLSIFTDFKLVNYLPSVIASATMLYVINEINHSNAMDYKNQFIDLLEIQKEKLEECYDLITELMRGYESRKRKHESIIPGSPSGVIDAYFSSDSSSDSWYMGSSVSSSPEKPMFKRSKAQDQHMRLASFR